jgi:hypothetical protein
VEGSFFSSAGSVNALSATYQLPGPGLRSIYVRVVPGTPGLAADALVAL